MLRVPVLEITYFVLLIRHSYCYRRHQRDPQATDNLSRQMDRVRYTLRGNGQDHKWRILRTFLQHGRSYSARRC